MADNAAVRWDVNVMPPEQADLPPSLAEVLGHWNAARADRWAPAWGEFNLNALSSTAIPYVLVLDVKRDPLDFVYRFWGTANTAVIGYDCTGKSVRENKRFGEKVFGECRQILEERRPLLYFSKVIREDGMVREYQRLRLPLSADGETVTQVVSILETSENLADLFENKKAY